MSQTDSETDENWLNYDWFGNYGSTYGNTGNTYGSTSCGDEYPEKYTSLDDLKAKYGLTYANPSTYETAGPKGPKGDTGNQGPKGNKGDKGDTGN